MTKALNEFKSLDGECLFLNEVTGETFYSSPDQDLELPLIVLGMSVALLPILMGLAFKLGGM